MMKAEKIVWYGLMGELPDGTSAIACAFARAQEAGKHTYLADDNTAQTFFDFCPEGKVSHVTESRYFYCLIQIKIIIIKLLFVVA